MSKRRGKSVVEDESTRNSNNYSYLNQYNYNSFSFLTLSKNKVKFPMLSKL